MAQAETETIMTELAPRKLVAVANTGPMLSVFQCGRIDLLQALFETIYVVPSTALEYEKHNAADLLLRLIDSDVVSVVPLSAEEQQRAFVVATQIAQSPQSRDPVSVSHVADAETIVLAQRLGDKIDFVPLDELAAREVAQEMGLPIVGFLGILRLARAQGLVTIDEIETLLKTCQQQGTHYSNQLIRNFCVEMRRLYP